MLLKDINTRPYNALAHNIGARSFICPIFYISCEDVLSAIVETIVDGTRQRQLQKDGNNGAWE